MWALTQVEYLFSFSGKGSERTEHYAGAEKVYMNIGNIHAVRDSARLLFKLWDPNRDTNQFVQKLDDSGWLKHVQKVPSW